MSFLHPRTLLAFLLAFPAILSAAAPADKPTAKQIAQWVKELGDDRFPVRENASKKLWRAGQAAESALEEAVKSEDVEVARRARDLLNKFHWGIFPDTPPDIVALIQAYRSTEGGERATILQKLLEAGPAGLRAALKISRIEKDPNQRRLLAHQVSGKLPLTFQRVLEEGKFADFEELLQIGFEEGFIEHNQYVAYWLLRGKLDERIAHFRARLEKTPNAKRWAEMLVYLHRAKGDLTEARKAAEKAESADLVDDLLCEAADWKTLASRPGDAGPERDAASGRTTLLRPALRAAFARLAGDRKSSADVLNEMRETLDKMTPVERERYQFTVAKAFLLNDRPADGLALLEKIADRREVLFDILCSRLQYREALALVDSPGDADSTQQRVLQILKARTLYSLGEKDQARKAFAHLAERIENGVEGEWPLRLVEEEQRLGLSDLALAHCARLQGVAVRWKRGAAKPKTIFVTKLYPQHTAAAEVWWEFLRRKYPGELPAATLKRLRDLFNGKTAAKEVQSWIEEAERILTDEKDRISPADRARQRQALAEAAVAAGLDALAVTYFDKADTREALIRLGDYLAGKQQWTKAAERYRQAWRKSPKSVGPGLYPDPLPLYLTGFSLRKSGKDKEGAKLMEQSHWALMGDAAGRLAFVLALAERGHTKAAQRETELLQRVSDPNSYYSGAASFRLAVRAEARKEPGKAADGFERSMLRCLHPFTSYVHAGAYAFVPSRIHRLRASALLAAGKIEEGMRQMELALECLPGNTDVPIHLVPALERIGRKKEATVLFDRLTAIYDKLCREYPRCALTHNHAAWMRACCRRDLDSALAHARKAVELEPSFAGYLDTLAEVHFQRGEKEKAVALQKRVIELNPKREYFRKQLRRLEAGNVAAELPSAEED